MNFENAIKSVVNDLCPTYRQTYIEQLINLRVNVDFKLSAAKTMFNDFCVSVFCETLHILKTWGKNAILPQWQLRIEDYLNNYSFRVTRFDARKKNVEHGSNEPLRINEGNLITNRSFNYAGKYSKYSGSYDQASYALLFHRTKPIFLYRNNDMKKPIRIDLSRVFEKHLLLETRFRFEKDEKIMIDGVLYTRASALIDRFRYVKLTWDELEKAFCFKNEKYHISSAQLWTIPATVNTNTSDFATIETLIKTVISSFTLKNKMRRQRNRQEKVTNYIKNNISSIFVTFEDSLKAGNCAKQTQEMYEKLEKIENVAIVKENDTIVSVRADFLLSLRNDHYTNNAVFQAAKRYI